jgi:phosphonate transport system substrate-binding protein
MYLTDKTGYQFHFKTARDIHTFRQRTSEGAYDLVYMNPYHYVTFHKTQGYRVFAKEKDRQLTGIIVVRADSPYRTLHDLENQSLSFPAPTAFAASLLTRAHLDREGIKYKTSFVASHDSVYLGVAQKLFAGGGGILHTLDAQPERIRNQLRVLWISKGYTPHALAAHPRVPPEAVQKIASAIVALRQDPNAGALLAPLGFNGFAPASDVEYNGVRALEPNMKALLKND